MNTTIPTGPEWLAYLTKQTGTDKWVCAPRLTANHRSKGYEVAIAPKRWAGLETAFNTLQAHAKAFNIAVALFPHEADRMHRDPDAWRVKIQAVRAALTAEGFL